MNLYWIETELAIIAFVAYVIYLETRKVRKRSEIQKKSMLLIGPTSSGRTHQSMRYVILLAELGKRVYNGASEPEDLPKWEEATAGIKESELFSDKGIAEFHQDIFTKYLLLHYPEDTRIPEPLREGAPIASELVREELVTLAIWDSYMALKDEQIDLGEWGTSVEQHIDISATDSRHIVFKERFEREVLISLASTAIDLIKQAIHYQAHYKWEKAVINLPDRLMNVKKGILANSNEGPIIE